jgi:hypothetical protein
MLQQLKPSAKERDWEATSSGLDVVVKIQTPVPARFQIVACSQSIAMNNCSSLNKKVTRSADIMSPATETMVTIVTNILLL